MKKVDSRRNAPYVIASGACTAWQSTIKPFRRDLGAACLTAKRKRFIPTPLPLTQKEKATAASSTHAAAGHYCPPYSRARAPRSGRESVRAYARDLKK